ncbi:MAG: glycerate kinase [Pseudonocardia sp.]|nr:glycerate kinase [Pseudonocardia sp.]
MALRVVIAPDSFKGSLDAAAVAEAIAAGWRTRRPDDVLALLPLADGGEGTLEALGHDLPAECLRTATVGGPDGRPVTAHWLLRPDGTAVVELATAAGLPQLDEPDPLGATTHGVGELLALAAADPGTRRIMLGLGGSATTDGGTGALTALGARFLDADGNALPPGGGALARLARVDLSALVEGPPEGVEYLVDVTSPLLGPHGAAAVFGPQKGASPAQVAELDAALARLAQVLGASGDEPGSGAAGGTSFGLLTCWGGRMVSGSATVAEVAGLGAAAPGADLVVTGEGRFDSQSVRGKVVGNVLDVAGRTPVAVVAGQVATDAPPAVTALSLTALAGSAEASMADPARWLGVAGAALAERYGSPR